MGSLIYPVIRGPRQLSLSRSFSRTVKCPALRLQTGIQIVEKVVILDQAPGMYKACTYISSFRIRHLSDKAIRPGCVSLRRGNCISVNLHLICRSIGVPQRVLEAPVKFSKQLQAEARQPAWILARSGLDSTNLEQEEILGPKSQREILAKRKGYWLEEIDISILKRLKCKSGIQVELQNQKVKKEKRGKLWRRLSISNGNIKGTQAQLAQVLEGFILKGQEVNSGQTAHGSGCLKEQEHVHPRRVRKACRCLLWANALHGCPTPNSRFTYWSSNPQDMRKYEHEDIANIISSFKLKSGSVV